MNILRYSVHFAVKCQGQTRSSATTERARQLHLSFSASSLIMQTVRHMHVKLNQAFTVIPGHPCWCCQKYRMVYGPNVQLMLTFFFIISEHIKIWQREIGKFVDFSDLTQV